MPMIREDWRMVKPLHPPVHAAGRNGSPQTPVTTPCSGCKFPSYPQTHSSNPLPVLPEPLVCRPV